MNYFIIFFIYFFYSFAAYSEGIKIIDLHSNVNDEIEAKDNETENIDNETENIDDEIENNDNNLSEIIILNEGLLPNQNEEKLSDNLNIYEDSNSNLEEENLNNENSLNSETKEVKSLPDLWQNSDKEDLEFLFGNLKINNSEVLTNLLLEALVGYVNAPHIYSQAEFDNLRIKTLINLGQGEKALTLINNINTYDVYKDYYDLLKLNY